MANTTSDSYSFDQNFSIDEIIADAYERIGLVGTAGHQKLVAVEFLVVLELRQAETLERVVLELVELQEQYLLLINQAELREETTVKFLLTELEQN